MENAAQHGYYPDETLHPSALSPSRFGRVERWITKRSRYQFTSMENAAQHWALGNQRKRLCIFGRLTS